MHKTRYKPLPLTRLRAFEYSKIIDTFDLMYSEILFLRKIMYTYLENSRILNGTQNLDASFLVVLFFTTPKFKIALIHGI